MKPRIIIDNNIPYIKGVLEKKAEVTYKEGDLISNEDLMQCQALITRTRTQCNKTLLENTPINIIATATIGFDHIDTQYCDENNIIWKNAPGCNANAVAQYISSAICYWCQKHNKALDTLTIGIIGAGHVGKAVEAICKKMGLTVLLNDPLREEKEKHINFSDISTISNQCDIISFHTPLTTKGKYPSQYLGNKDFFEKLKKKPLIINAARGGVIKERALLTALNNTKISDCIIDCWENEPNINKVLCQNALISTPHIAGYSADGKANATKMSVRSISKYFNLGLDNFSVNELSIINPLIISNEQIITHCLNSYSINKDSETLKLNPELFEKQRKTYNYRREIPFILSK